MNNYSNVHYYVSIINNNVNEFDVVINYSF